jgi:hypothetical protein
VPSESLTPKQALTVLSATPARIAALTDRLTPAQLRTAPRPYEWSANDVLGHLRSCSDMWGGYIRKILAEDQPTIRAVSPRAWINETDYLKMEFQPSLRAFTTQRADLLAVLEPLSPEDWSRAALVTGVGRPLERTALDYAERLARHERPHVNQIERIVTTLRE